MRGIRITNLERVAVLHLPAPREPPSHFTTSSRKSIGYEIGDDFSTGFYHFKAEHLPRAIPSYLLMGPRRMTPINYLDALSGRHTSKH